MDRVSLALFAVSLGIGLVHLFGPPVPRAATWVAILTTAWLLVSRKGHAILLTVMAMTLAELSLRRLAVRFARRAVVRAPGDSLPVSILCGILLSTTEDPTEVENLARSALIKHPNHGGICRYLGLALLAGGAIEEGLPLVREALQNRALSARGQLRLGLALAGLGVCEEALDALRRARWPRLFDRLTRQEHTILEQTLASLGTPVRGWARPIILGIWLGLHLLVAVGVFIAVPPLLDNGLLLTLAHHRGPSGAWAGRLVAHHRDRIEVDLIEGRYLEALRRWQMLKESFLSAREGQAAINLEEGAIYERLGDFRRAEALYKEADRLIHELDPGLQGWHPGVAFRLAKMALTHPQPDLAAAELYLKGAPVEEEEQEWSTLTHHAYLTWKEREKAYTLALSRAEDFGTRALLSEYRSNWAEALVRLEARLETLQKADELFRIFFLGEKVSMLLNTTTFRGGVLKARRITLLMHEAKATAARGLTWARLRRVAIALNDVSRTAIATAQATHELERFFALWRQLSSPEISSAATRVYDTPLDLLDQVWEIESELAEFRAAVGRPLEAFELASSAIHRLEGLRAPLPVQGRAYLPASPGKQPAYRRAVRLALAAGKPEQAFVFLEWGRSRLLLEQLTSQPQTDERWREHRDFWVGPLNPQEARAALINIGQQFHAQMVRLLSTGALRSGRAVVEENFLDALRHAQRDLLLAYPLGIGPARIGGTHPLTEMEQVQKVLHDNEAFLTYFLDDRATSGFLVTSKGFQHFHVPLPTVQLSDRAREYIRLFDAGPPVSPRAVTFADELGRGLLAPILQDLVGIERLFIAPSGVLRRLSFASLRPSDHTFLGEYLPIVYVPSASYLVSRRADAKSNPLRFLLDGPGLVIADPFGDLPQSRREVSALVGRPDVKMLAGVEATEEHVAALLPQVEWVHLGTHGYVDGQDPLFSAVLLQPSANQDGILTVEELLNLASASPLRLVTLAACETEVSRVLLPGDEDLTVGQAFLATGATSVVASFWRVADDATADLMAVFYEGLANGHLPDRALQLAQQHLRQRGTFPEHWAGFGIFGVVE